MNLADNDALHIAHIADALRDDQCPPPQIFLPWEWRDLDATQRQAFNTHVADCAACQSERRLAEDFGAEEAGVASGGRTFEFGALAATLAMCILGLGYWFGHNLQTRAPVASAERVMRGAGIELLRTEGLSAPMRWTSVDGANHYQVTARNAAGAIVWQTRAEQPTAMPPQPKDANGLRWRWQVEAYDANGVLVAQSPEGEYTFSAGAKPGFPCQKIKVYEGRRTAHGE